MLYKVFEVLSLFLFFHLKERPHKTWNTCIETTTLTQPMIYSRCAIPRPEVVEFFTRHASLLFWILLSVTAFLHTKKSFAYNVMIQRSVFWAFSATHINSTNGNCSYCYRPYREYSQLLTTKRRYKDDSESFSRQDIYENKKEKCRFSELQSTRPCKIRRMIIQHTKWA